MIQMSRSQLESLIDEWVTGRDAERNRNILKRRYIDGIKYESLAEEFNLSTRQVKNIVYKSERNLLSHI